MWYCAVYCSGANAALIVNWCSTHPCCFRVSSDGELKLRVQLVIFGDELKISTLSVTMGRTRAASDCSAACILASHLLFGRICDMVIDESHVGPCGAVEGARRQPAVRIYAKSDLGFPHTDSYVIT